MGATCTVHTCIEILVNSSLKTTTKKNCYDHLKNSGEQSRAILALLITKVMPLFSAKRSRQLQCSVVTLM